jgi:hypothetical protein
VENCLLGAPTVAIVKTGPSSVGHALSASYGAPGHNAPSRLGITASGLPLTADVRAAGGIGRDGPLTEVKTYSITSPLYRAATTASKASVLAVFKARWLDGRDLFHVTRRSHRTISSTQLG